MDIEKLKSEVTYKAVRSSGPGGQNVNKVASKVMLTFDLQNSLGLEEEEKEYLKVKIASKLTQDFLLIISSDEDRSQLKNKTIVLKKFLETIEKGLKKPNVRKATKVPRAVNEKRIQKKKNTGAIKETRKKPKL